MKNILVNGDEAVRCVVLDGSDEQNRRTTINALRMGAGISRLVMIGNDELIATTLRPFAMYPTEVECAPVGTPVPHGKNVVVFTASKA